MLLNSFHVEAAGFALRITHSVILSQEIEIETVYSTQLFMSLSKSVSYVHMHYTYHYTRVTCTDSVIIAHLQSVVLVNLYHSYAESLACGTW